MATNTGIVNSSAARVVAPLLVLWVLWQKFVG